MEAEIVSLDAGTRMDGIPSLLLWELMLTVMYQLPSDKLPKRKFKHNGIYELLATVDHVPATLPRPLGNAKLVLLEDNDAVIKMIIKGRTHKLKYVPGIHRIDLDLGALPPGPP